MSIKVAFAGFLSAILLSTFITPQSVAQDQPASADAKAVAAIEELGGIVRRISAQSDSREVDFRLGGRELTDEGLSHIASLKNVISLNLKGTKITDAGLKHISAMTELRELHLETTEIGDDGVAHLKGLGELEYLNLYATNVTDKSLEQIAGFKKLKRLYLWQTDVSDEAVARLEEALPALSIVRGASLDGGSTARKRIVMGEQTIPLAGEPWTITGIVFEDGPPGEDASGKLHYRAKGETEFASAELTRAEDKSFAAVVPAGATSLPLQYFIRIRQPKQAPSTFPPAGAKEPAEVAPDAAPPTIAEAPKVGSAMSYGVALSWPAATDDSGIKSYAVYRAAAEADIAVKDNLLAELEPDVVQFDDTKPPAGTSVHYAVQPTDIAGRVGPVRIVKVDIPKDMPPKNDLALTAAAGSKAIVLNWKGQIEPDVDTVLVFRAETADAEPQQVAELKSSEAENWIDEKVADDAQYHYFIKLRDAGGLESEPSGKVVAKAGGFLRRINCGGPEITSADGANWEADQGNVTGTGRFTAKEKVNAAPEGLQDVYQTERWSYRGVRYRFDASPGRYRATLHFAETNNGYAAEGKRTFDVMINGEKLKEAVDVFASAGKATAWQLPIDFEVTGDEIDIELRKVAAGPAIKGIEIREIAKASP